MRKNAIVSVDTSVVGEITFDVVGAGSIALTIAQLSADVVTRATVHGIVQKVSDAAALGKDATPSDKFAAMSAVVARLLDGEWKMARGDGSSAVAGIIYRAYREFVNAKFAAAKKPAPDETALRAQYDAKSRSDQLALRTVPEISTIIERMKSESGPVKTVDTEALLADLGL